MHRRPHSGEDPPHCLRRKFSINQAFSSIMHQPLQPVTLLQPFNEAARPGGHRPHITPVKSRCSGAKPPWPQTIVQVMQAGDFSVCLFVCFSPCSQSRKPVSDCLQKERQWQCANTLGSKGQILNSGNKQRNAVEMTWKEKWDKSESTISED